MTVSGQLEGETYAEAFRNIYTFGPTFRAENSNTVKHAAEFWMIEPEMAFADLTDYLDTAEAMIKYIAQGSTTFVTNAVSHARLLAARNFKVYLLGGEFKAITEAIVGEEAVVTLAKYNFTKGFWGANGISIQKGYSTPEVKEALVKQISMENCEECYVLSDDSKLDQVSSVSFAPFKSARLITTGNIPQTFLKCANVIRI